MKAEWPELNFLKIEDIGIQKCFVKSACGANDVDDDDVTEKEEKYLHCFWGKSISKFFFSYPLKNSIFIGLLFFYLN